MRRTVRKLVECVDHEHDTMLVLRRRRPISGSLGTALKPNYKKALPLLRAVAALVRGPTIPNLLGLLQDLIPQQLLWQHSRVPKARPPSAVQPRRRSCST